MRELNFEVKNVPVLAEVDVLVVGSGTAGIAAAVVFGLLRGDWSEAFRLFVLLFLLSQP